MTVYTYIPQGVRVKIGDTITAKRGVTWDREQIKTLKIKINRIIINNGGMVMGMEIMRDIIEEMAGITIVIWAMENMMVGTTGVIETR